LLLWCADIPRAVGTSRKNLLMRSPDILIFIRMAGDIAACLYYTGIDPFTKQEVFVARHRRDRKLQRELMQFFKPENYFMVREALIQAGRGDLIGGCAFV
jgi:hypothetical protein